MQKLDAGRVRWGRAAVAFALWLAASLPTRPALAQDEPSQEGIRIGDSRLQPGIDVGTAFDSNVYRTETDAEWDLVQLISPRLRWLYPGADTYFLVGAQYHLRKYWGLGVDEDDEIGHTDLDIYDNFTLRLRLDANRRGKVNPVVSADLHKQSQALDSAQWPFLPESLMHHFVADTKVGVKLKPRSALILTPGIYYSLDDHRTGTTGARERWATGHEVTGLLDVEWRFFPKTSLLLNLEVGGLAWSFRPTDNPELQEAILEASLVDEDAAQLLDLNLYDSVHWRTWFGVQGRFSRKLSIQALFGYANIYFPDDPNAGQPGSRAQLTGADGILGRLQVHLRPTQSQLITVGFLRDYRYTYFSNYYLSTSPYLRYQGIFADRIDANATISYAYREIFGDISRTDHQIDVRAGVGVRVRKWLEPWLEYSLLAIPKSSDPDVNFAAHMVQLRVDLGF